MSCGVGGPVIKKRVKGWSDTERDYGRTEGPVSRGSGPQLRGAGGRGLLGSAPFNVDNN